MGFLDLFRRRKPAPTVTLGLPGVTVWDGRVDEGERNSELTGSRRYRTFSDLIRNTSAVAAGVRTYLDFLGTQWRADPADESARAEEIAESVHNAIHGASRPWHRIVKRSATYMLYGFDLQEVTLQRTDKGVTLKSIDPRPQHTIELWDADEHGRIAGVLQRSIDGRQEYLPIWKLVYACDDSLTDSPAGLGVLRQVMAPARRLAHYEMLEGKGFETDLRGIPIGRAPIAALQAAVKAGTMTQTEANARIAHIKTLVQKHVRVQSAAPLGLVMDSMVYTGKGDQQTPSSVYKESLELLNGGSQGFQEIAAAISRQNHEIARVLGVEHILLGQDRGTQALSRDKTDSLRRRIESILDELAWTFQRDVVDPICRANGWPEEMWPSIEHDPIRQNSVEDLAGTLESMARAGAVLQPDDPVINAIRDLARLPHAPELTDMEADAGLRGGDKADEDDELDMEPDDVEDDSDEAEKRRAWSSPLVKAHKTHTGVMIALFVPPAYAKSLVIPNGEDAEDLHVTLAYLGKNLSLMQRRAALRVVEELAQSFPPFLAILGGVERFSASESSDGKDVIYASVEDPVIHQMRTLLVQQLGDIGIPVSTTFDYVPHITLGYVDPGEPAVISELPIVGVRFESASLAAGPDRAAFTFKGSPI